MRGARGSTNVRFAKKTRRRLAIMMQPAGCAVPPPLPLPGGHEGQHPCTHTAFLVARTPARRAPGA